MFAGDKTSLMVSRIPVAIVRKVPVDAYMAAGPSQHSIVWDIAPEQIISVCEVNWPLRPKCAGMESFDPGVSKRQIQKSFVVNFEFVSNAGFSDHCAAIDLSDRRSDLLRAELANPPEAVAAGDQAAQPVQPVELPVPAYLREGRAVPASTPAYRIGPTELVPLVWV